jgi:hypothetical protein
MAGSGVNTVQDAITFLCQRSAAGPGFGETNPTLLLFPLVTNQFLDPKDNLGRTDTIISIINSNQQPFEIQGGAATTDCVMHFFGVMTFPFPPPLPLPVPAPIVFTLEPGQHKVFYIGTDATGALAVPGVAKGFVGYVIVQCNFPGGYGYAQIADRVGGSSGYVAVQLPPTRVSSANQMQSSARMRMGGR